MISPAKRSLLLLFLFAGFLAISSGSERAAGQSHQLLKNAEVLLLLGIAEEHHSQLETIAENAKQLEKRLEMQLTGGKDFDSLPAVKQVEVRGKFLTEIVAIDEAALQEVKKHLDSDQLRRLENLRIQLLGPAGFVSGSLDKALGLTPGRRTELLAISAEFQKTFTEKYKAEIEGLPRNELNRFYQSRLIDAFLAELGKETEDLYRSLAGEPFEKLPVVTGIR
jgi:hypothetical protein